MIKFMMILEWLCGQRKNLTKKSIQISYMKKLERDMNVLYHSSKLI